MVLGINAVDFPSELSQPLISNYQFQQGQPFIRIQVSDGRSRYRLRNRRPPMIFDVVWNWTEEEFQLFRIWFQSFSFQNQNQWFKIGLAAGFVGPDGVGPRVIQETICHFVEGVVANINQATNTWLVSAQLEGQYQSPGGILENNFIDGLPITQTRPTLILDGKQITETRPDFIVDGGSPVIWQQ